MRILLIFFIFFSNVAFAKGGRGGHVHVHGYTRHDGTYVQPHHRTAPDGTKMNNWSHVGNINPYTGKVGTNTDGSPNYNRGYSYQYSGQVYRSIELPPPPTTLYIQN